jgi:hypothetical protein
MGYFMVDDGFDIQIDVPHSDEPNWFPDNGVLGILDRETEGKFGEITFSTRAVGNIDRLSRMHLGSEIGGLLVGWEEDGKRNMADTLVYVPDEKLVGQFKIMDGLEHMTWALDRMRENPDYEGHNLEVLGWWHTHPSESRAEDGMVIPPHPPVPGGGKLGDGRATGDMGVTECFSRLYGKPQEMLIVQTSRPEIPVDLALWRWDDTDNAEAAIFQRGIRLVQDESIPRVGYWQLPEGGQQVYKFVTPPEEIITVDIDGEQQQEVIDLTQADLAAPGHIDFSISEEELNSLEPVIEIVDTGTQQELSVDLREIYKPGMKEKLNRMIGVIGSDVKVGKIKLGELKNRLTHFLTGPWDSMPEIRIEIDQALQRIEDFTGEEDIASQIEITEE